MRTFPRHARFATAVADGGRSAGGDDEAAAISSLRRILRAYARPWTRVRLLPGHELRGRAAPAGVRQRESVAERPFRLERRGRRRGAVLLAARRHGAGPADAPARLVPAVHGRLPARAVRVRRVPAEAAPEARRAHLERENVQPAMYATHWFVTVFAAQFPAPFAARAWSLPGRGGLVYQIGVALLAARERELLALDFEDERRSARSGGSRDGRRRADAGPRAPPAVCRRATWPSGKALRRRRQAPGRL